MYNYHPYMILNGIEHIDHNPMDLRLAYDEAKRFYDEYQPTEAGIKVFTPDVFRILSWKNGEHRKLKGHYLYTIMVGEEKHPVVYSDEGHFIADYDPGELIPVQTVELPF